MANPFTEYLRQTRGELRHVAWPTRAQTIIYAGLVAAISIGIALYLGLFDFLFTAGLSRLLSVLPQGTPPAISASTNSTSSSQGTSPITITQIPTHSTSSGQATLPQAPTPKK